ncbi:MAG: archaeal heat shock protein Hsp20 [Candidatus Micrarchaeota archaeon]
MNKRRRGSFGFGGWPFGDDDEDPFGDFPGFGGFGQIDEIMNKLLEDMAKNQKNLKPGEPIVYGVNIRVGPDGKPHVQQFGNVGKGEVKEEREPLVDVINHAKEIRVIAEIPGVEKNDINLKTTADSLSIIVRDPQRKFAKTLKLPEAVLEDSAKASYKNGILEVVLQKRKPSEKKTEGKEVKIE